MERVGGDAGESESPSPVLFVVFGLNGGIAVVGVLDVVVEVEVTIEGVAGFVNNIFGSGATKAEGSDG